MILFLLQVFYAAIVLTILYVFIGGFLWLFQPKAAVIHRLAWFGVLLVPLFAMSLPVSIPIWSAGVSPASELESVLPTSELVSVLPSLNTDETFTNPQAGGTPAIQKNSPDLKHFVPPLLFAVWLGGIGVLLLRRLKRSRKMRCYLKEQATLGLTAPANALALWRSLLRSYGIAPARIRFLVTDSLGPALVSSGFRSYLLIPQTVCEDLSDEMLEGVFRHELAHDLHRDTVMTPLARLLAEVMWFHPFARRALAHYEAAVEWCCDEFAYLRPDRSGSALLAETFVSVYQGTESLALDTNTFARYNTIERVDRLIRSETFGKETPMKKTLLIALLSLLFLGGTLRIELVARETPEQNPASAPTADTVYTGTVVDEDGQPAGGVKVQSTRTGEETLTNEKGEFTLPLVKWDTYIATDRHRMKIGVWTGWQSNDYQIELQKARRITGTVVCPEGKPAAAITVVGGFQTVFSEIVNTNDQGEFDFLFPDNERLSLQVICAFQKGKGLDFVSTRENPLYSNYGATPPELISNGPFHLKLRPIEPVNIRVVDEDGQPITGARVTPWVISNPTKPEDLKAWNDHRGSFNTSGLNGFEAITNTEGYAVVDSVPKEFLEETIFAATGPPVEGTAARFGSELPTWKSMSQDGQPPTVTLPRAALVRGRVTLDDSTPVGDAQIHLRFHNGACGIKSTNPKGEFDFEFNVHTLLNISVNSKLGAAPAVFGFSVGDGSEVKRLDFVLKKGIRLHGKVYNEDGLRLKQFDVTINAVDPDPPESFAKDRYDNEKRSPFHYGTNWADLLPTLHPETGEYEILLPAVPHEYYLSVREIPSTGLGGLPYTLQVQGDEEEIEYDLHLKDPFKMSY